jgi:ABC-type phosphate transport system substrate-binding protein
MHRPRRLLAAAVAVALAAGALGIIGALPASSAGVGGRSATATPTEGLRTQVARISWSGFRPTNLDSGLYAVNVVQCRANPKSIQDCDNRLAFPNPENGTRVTGAITGPDGTGSALIEIRAAADLPSLACTQSRPCSALVYEVTGPTPTNRLPDAYALAPLEFAPSAADCPPVKQYDVRTGGEASGGPLLYSIAAERCTGADPQIIDYTETSSNLGRQSLLQGQIDVGITSLPATAEERAAVTDPPAVAYAPLDLTAITVVFTMRDPGTGLPITDLVLTPRLVARIISESDLGTFFADPELRRLNPGVHWPAVALASPLVRAEKNADTWMTTAWLNGDRAARALLDGNDPEGVEVSRAWKSVVYPTDEFGALAGPGSYQPFQGETPVVRRVFYGVRPSDSVPARPDTFGFVGIVDLPTARRYNLPVARLVNAAGVAVAPTEKSVLAGFHAMDVAADGTRRPTAGGRDADAYPLVKVDYAMVTRQSPSEARRTSIASFLRYVAGAAQDSLPPGYTALPAELVGETNAVADSLTVGPSGPGDGPSNPGGVTSPTSDFGPVGYDSSASYDTGTGGTTGGAAGGGATGGGTGSGAAARRGAAYSPIASYGRGTGGIGLAVVLGLGLVAGIIAVAPRVRRATRRLRRPASS